jgi:hypothetical protein
MKPRRPRKLLPPPEIDSCLVLKYAFIEKPVRYVGRNNLFVINPETGESWEIGAVPRLAIARPLRRSREYLLLHCDREWRCLGTHAGFKSVAQAAERAERSYPGVAKLWRSRGVSKKAALAYERRVWKNEECSFCGRIPPEIAVREGTSLVQSKSGKASICKECIEECFELVQPERPQSNST